MSSFSSPRRRAFSLIEAAIVLAIVGLVIGGLWAAASSARETYRANKISEDMMTIMQNVRKKGGGGFWGGAVTTTWIGDDMGLVPSSYTRHPTATNYNWFVSPYYSKAYVRLQISGTGMNAGQYGSVYLITTGWDIIETPACTRIIMNLMNAIKSYPPGTDYGVQFLIGFITYTYYPDTVAAAMPLVPGLCRASGGTSSIRLFFPT